MSAVEVDNLRKYFGNTKAVDGVSFSVEEGDLFGFLGPNGAGKTTTIRCMMDFIRPLGGSITILRKDAQEDSVELKKKIGYLPGNVYLYSKWTGQTHIDFVRQFNAGKDISLDLINRLGFDPTVKTKHLSPGNKQKLGLILAFMTNPEVLILDEPTLGLDPLLQNEVVCPILVIVMLLAIAGSGLAGEVEQGTAELLLSHPLSPLVVLLLVAVAVVCTFGAMWWFRRRDVAV